VPRQLSGERGVDDVSDAPAPFPAEPTEPLGSYGLGLPDGVSLTSPVKRIGSMLLDGALIIVTLVIGWCIWAAFTAPNGQTPGKKLLDIRVVDSQSAQPVGFSTMFFLRGLIGGVVAQIVFTFTLGVLAFMPFWDKRNQTIYEKVSGTLVVNDPTNAWYR
jgi:uncharacterized RDD family membrane protein YckC